MPVDAGELFGDRVEPAGLVGPVDLSVKLEALDAVANNRDGPAKIGVQVLGAVVLVTH